MAQEVELKLALSAEDAEKLVACGLLPGRPKTVRQTSLYFDTDDKLLHRSGLSLRIRTERTRKVQTVKACRNGGSGLFMRGEWECPVDTDVPIPGAAAPLVALLKGRRAEIAPLFRVEIARSKWMVSDALATIEVVLDRGAVQADGRHSPVCEVELELKAGDPAALFTLAHRIAAVVPVRLGILSKSGVGYRSLAGGGGAAKAEPVPLTPEMTTAEAVQHIVHNCIRQFRLNEDRLLEQDDPAAIHQARVALRRLRSALMLFRKVLKDRRLAHFAGDLRWLTNKLGRARDIDVLLATDVPESLETGLHEARAAAYGEVHATLGSERARRLMLDLAEWISLGKWQARAKREALRTMPITAFASDRLKQLYRRIRRRGGDITALDEEARHDLRKAAKKLRYSAEFLSTLYGDGKARKQCGRFIAALEAVQDRLGALTDMAAHRALLEDLGLAMTGEIAAELPPVDRDRMLASAGDAMAHLADAKAYWRTG